MKINRLLDTMPCKCRFKKENSFPLWCRWPQVLKSSFLSLKLRTADVFQNYIFQPPWKTFLFLKRFFPPQPMLAQAPCELRGLSSCVTVLRVKMCLFVVAYALLAGMGTRVASERGVLGPQAARTFQGDLAAASIVTCWMCHSSWHSLW